MKSNLFVLSILFLFLSMMFFTSCEMSDDNEIYETEIKGVDKDIQRPGTQGVFNDKAVNQYIS